MVDFIDALFAVTIGTSFQQILYERWFNQLPWLWNKSTCFEVLTLGLAYLTVILSWQGYHESIRNNPIKDAPRFFIDIILLIEYFLLLVKYMVFWLELLLLAIIYLSYIPWDYYKIKEIRDGNLDNGNKEINLTTIKKRNMVTRIWCFIFLVLFILYLFLSRLTFLAKFMLIIKYFFLFGAMFGIILYRKHKKELWLVSLIMRIFNCSS